MAAISSIFDQPDNYGNSAGVQFTPAISSSMTDWGTAFTPAVYEGGAGPWKPAQNAQSWSDAASPLTGNSNWSGSYTPTPIGNSAFALPPMKYDYGNADYEPGYNGSYGVDWTSGSTYGTLATDYGANVIESFFDDWLAKNHPELTSGFNSGTGANSGAVANIGGAWADVDAWTQDILNATAKVGSETGVYVPPNLVKAIMKLESNGDPQSVSTQGATGLMQVMPSIWGTNEWGLNINDNAQNIELGVRILVSNYNQGMPNDPTTKNWEEATKRYLGLGTSDALGTTDDEYWQTVNNNWTALDNSIDQTRQTGGQQATTGTTGFTAVWGNFTAPVTQGFGWTDFAQNGAGSEYDYTSDYTYDHQPMGHAGVDVGVAKGTTLYTPISGKVIDAGGTGFYCDDDPGENGCGQGVGELLIQEANGDQVILGHMSDITVHVGDTVNAGQFVGYSGASNGAHVHIEYRKYLGSNGVGTNGTTQTASGYLVVDPQVALNTAFSGTYGGTNGSTGATQATSAQDSWSNYMQAVAQGKPINNMAVDTGDFHGWMLNFLTGKTNPVAANPFRLVGGSNSTSPTAGMDASQSKIVSEVTQYVGAPYKWGVIPGVTTDPATGQVTSSNPFVSGWDCSGMVYYLNQKYGDKTMPEGSHYQYQYAQQHGALNTDPSKVKVGDILFFYTENDDASVGGNLNNASHVGIYIGNNQFIEAANPTDGTVIVPLSTFSGTFLGSMTVGWS